MPPLDIEIVRGPGYLDRPGAVIQKRVCCPVHGVTVFPPSSIDAHGYAAQHAHCAELHALRETVNARRTVRHHPPKSRRRARCR